MDFRYSIEGLHYNGLCPTSRFSGNAFHIIMTMSHKNGLSLDGRLQPVPTSPLLRDLTPQYSAKSSRVPSVPFQHWKRQLRKLKGGATGWFGRWKMNELRGQPCEVEGGNLGESKEGNLVIWRGKLSDLKRVSGWVECGNWVKLKWVNLMSWNEKFRNLKKGVLGEIIRG